MKKNSPALNAILYVVLGVVISCVGLIGFASCLPDTDSPKSAPVYEATAKPSTIPVPTRVPATRTPKPGGESRDNPVPVGHAAIVDQMSLSVIGYDPAANTVISGGNMFNADPEPGNHYIIVQVSMSCEAPADHTCRVFEGDFAIVDDAGVVHEREWMVAGVDGLLEGGEFYSKGTKSGRLVFIVPDWGDDYGVPGVLRYSSFWGDEAYFAIK